MCREFSRLGVMGKTQYPAVATSTKDLKRRKRSELYNATHVEFGFSPSDIKASVKPVTLLQEGGVRHRNKHVLSKLFDKNFSSDCYKQPDQELAVSV